MFDGAGALYVAQRGALVGSYDYSVFAKPEASNVLRYVWDETEKRWSEKPDEYAVGLKPPHRSTVGGIALNYGYDPDGTIDYDQCRATLWTTGEHLREGKDENRVFAGGARIIHGLQGNDKGAVRPANEPPYDAWFVDNDGLYLDADVYGHVGDIAIFNPCDKRTITEPEPLPFPEEYGEPGEPSVPPYPEDTPPDLSTPGIYIDKECFPGIIGGEIHCEITVTNVGETLSDPIDLYDVATAFGGGGVTITGVTPDGPDWICTPTPTPDLWCSLPPDAIDPGETRSIDVFLDTGPLFAGGSFGFVNCAELEAPWHDVACDEGGTDITVTKTAPAACVPGADCTFTVTITNTGAFPFSGPVQFTDSTFMGWPFLGPFGLPITPSSPPSAVRRPRRNSTSRARRRSHSRPASRKSLPLRCRCRWRARSPAIGSKIASPSQPRARPRRPCHSRPAPTTISSAASGCRSARLRRSSNLRLDKRALNSGDCYKVGAALIRCDYEIEIFNDGPSPFVGAITFIDAFRRRQRWLPPSRRAGAACLGRH